MRFLNEQIFEIAGALEKLDVLGLPAPTFMKLERNRGAIRARIQKMEAERDELLAKFATENPDIKPEELKSSIPLLEKIRALLKEPCEVGLWPFKDTEIPVERPDVSFVALGVLAFHQLFTPPVGTQVEPKGFQVTGTDILNFLVEATSIPAICVPDLVKKDLVANYREIMASYQDLYKKMVDKSEEEVKKIAQEKVVLLLTPVNLSSFDFMKSSVTARQLSIFKPFIIDDYDMGEPV